MAERIQLKEPGAQFDMLVSSVKEEVIERNDYYLFSNGQKELLVPQSSVQSRLERLDLADVYGMVGRWVRFGRSMKMSRANKPYWDIDWAAALHGAAAQKELAGNGSGAEQSAGGEMGKPTAGTPSAAPSAEPARTKLTKLYLDATEFVIDKVLPKYIEAGIEVSDSAIIAAVATLFIAGSKER